MVTITHANSWSNNVKNETTYSRNPSKWEIKMAIAPTYCIRVCAKYLHISSHIMLTIVLWADSLYEWELTRLKQIVPSHFQWVAGMEVKLPSSCLCSPIINHNIILWVLAKLSSQEPGNRFPLLQSFLSFFPCEKGLWWIVSARSIAHMEALWIR